MIDNELAERFKSILEKEMNEISKELAKNSKNKLSDLVREHFEDLQAIVKIKREKKLGGYEYAAYLISSSGIELTADTLKTIMWRIKNEKLQKKRTSHPKNLILDPQKELTETVTQPPKPELPHIPKDEFISNMQNINNYFRDLPDEYHDDKTYALMAVEESAANYNYLSLRLKLDHEIALKTINRTFIRNNLVSSMYDEKEFMEKVLSISGSYYDQLTDRLKKDKHLAEIAIKTTPPVYKRVQKHISDIELAKLAITLDRYHIRILTDELKLELNDYINSIKKESK